MLACARNLPLLARWLGAACLVALNGAAMLLLQQSMAQPPPQLLLLPSVIIAAATFGRGSGFVAVVLATIVAAVAFAPHPTAPGDWVGILAFAAVGGLGAIVVEAFHRTVLALAQTNSAYLQAERRRTLLLQEFRHRSRNDLQSLAALLQLRARAAASPEVGEALRDAAGHATTLSRVHAWLAPHGTAPDDPATIDTHHFIEGLAGDLFAKHSAALRPVAVRVDAEPHPLDTERAVQLGLALNELVRSAYDHAFPNERPGGVDVAFHRENGSFVLAVADDGVGDTAEERRSSGLGTRMLAGLAAQLRGSFRRYPIPTGGTRAELRFPVSPQL